MGLKRKEYNKKEKESGPSKLFLSFKTIKKKKKVGP
jgi:hypothetical protein